MEKHIPRKKSWDLRKTTKEIEELWAVGEPWFTAWKNLVIGSSKAKALRRREMVKKLSNQRIAARMQLEDRMKKVSFDAFVKNWLNAASERAKAKPTSKRLVPPRMASPVTVTLDMRRAQRSVDGAKSSNTYIERESSQRHYIMPRVYSATLQKTQPLLFLAQEQEEHIRSSGLGGVRAKTTSPRPGSLSPSQRPLRDSGSKRPSPPPPRNSSFGGKANTVAKDSNLGASAPPFKSDTPRSPILRAGSRRKIIDPSAPRPNFDSSPVTPVINQKRRLPIAAREVIRSSFQRQSSSNEIKVQQPKLNMKASFESIDHAPPSSLDNASSPIVSSALTQKSSLRRKRPNGAVKSPKTSKTHVSAAQLCIDKPYHVLRRERRKAKETHTSSTDRPRAPITSSAMEKFGPYTNPGVESPEGQRLLPPKLDEGSDTASSMTDVSFLAVSGTKAQGIPLRPKIFVRRTVNLKQPLQAPQGIPEPPPGFVRPPEDSREESEEEADYSSDCYSDDSFCDDSQVTQSQNVKTQDFKDSKEIVDHSALSMLTLENVEDSNIVSDTGDSTVEKMEEENTGELRFEECKEEDFTGVTAKDWEKQELQTIGPPPQLPKPITYMLGKPPDSPIRLPKAESRPALPTNRKELQSKSSISLEVHENEMKATFKHPLPVTSPNAKYPLRYEQGLTLLKRMESGFGITQSIAERKQMMGGTLNKSTMVSSEVQNTAEMSNPVEDPATHDAPVIQDKGPSLDAVLSHQKQKTSIGCLPDNSNQSTVGEKKKIWKPLVRNKLFYQQQHKRKKELYVKLFLGTKSAHDTSDNKLSTKLLKASSNHLDHPTAPLG